MIIPVEDAQTQGRAPVSGTCAECGCPLGYVASQREGVWYCCGACGDSGRCGCGCQPDEARELSSDVYVPGRRMFGSRHPDELRTQPGHRDGQRAFPFLDRRRGR